MHEHVFFEDARADAHEGQPVAMTLVHVRLDLENEAGEGVAGRFDDRLLAGDMREPRRGRRREFEQRIEKRLDAKIVDGASEVDRNHAAMIELIGGE